MDAPTGDCRPGSGTLAKNIFLPRDVAVTEWDTNNTRIEQLISFGIRSSRVPTHEVDDGINGVRMSFKHDECGGAEGLKALRA